VGLRVSLAQASSKQERKEAVNAGKQAATAIEMAQKEAIILNELRPLSRSEYRTKNELGALLGGKRVNSFALIERMIADGKVEQVSAASDPRIIKRDKNHLTCFRLIPSYKQERWELWACLNATNQS
jgi:hypothetical protein